MDEKTFGNIHYWNRNSLDLCRSWPTPTVIVVDGPYGVRGFKGDLVSHKGLDQWYEPFIKQWSAKAAPYTTLWFWCTEVGWATVHPMFAKYGFEYVSCNIWDKGLSHVAGNVNTKTIRRLPVVTEVCVQYVKKPMFLIDGKEVEMKHWLIHEWKRTGLPLSKTNEACGVKNAASRKYFDSSWLWYFPPEEMFELFCKYANQFGKESGRPYFSLDGKRPLTREEWGRMRAQFHCPIGVTNVWRTNQLSGPERLKNKYKALHLNQKPLELIERIIEISSSEGDVIWDPFGGLFTTAIACQNLNRICYISEINEGVFAHAVERLTK